MRHALALAILIAAAAAAGAVAQAGHAQPCALEGSHTRYRDDSVRVYSKVSRDRQTERYYACLFSANRRVQVAAGDGPLYADDGAYFAMHLLHTAPPFIGLHFVKANKGQARATPVKAIDLRTGAKRSAFAVEPVGLGVTRRGSMAWMDVGPDGYVVHKLDAGATDQVVLDSGPNIESDSFAVGGRWIYWIHDGAPQSATMR